MISLSSSTVFLYLTFNYQINSFLSSRFDFLTPFTSRLFYGITICLVYSSLKKRAKKTNKKQQSQSKIIRKLFIYFLFGKFSHIFGSGSFSNTFLVCFINNFPTKQGFNNILHSYYSSRTTEFVLHDKYLFSVV